MKICPKKNVTTNVHLRFFFSSGKSSIGTTTTTMSSSSQEFLEKMAVDANGQPSHDDNGSMVGVVIGTLIGLTCLVVLVGFLIYRRVFQRPASASVRATTKFDNPIYRPTTEGKVSLAKEVKKPVRAAEETREPLTNPHEIV